MSMRNKKFLDELYSLLRNEKNAKSKSLTIFCACEIDIFLYEYLNKDNKHNYAKIIYQHMDEILSHCRLNSLDWVNNPLLMRYKGYPEKIYQFVLHYREPEKISRLLTDDLGSTLETCPALSNIFNSKRFVDDLISLGYDEEIYCDIFGILDCETQKYFIDRLIEEQISLPRYKNITKYYECEDYIKSRSMDIAKYTTSCFELRRACGDDVDELNQYFEEHPEVVFNTIRERVREILLFRYNNEIDDSILDVVEMIVREVMQSDNTKVSELDSNNTGCYSFVIFTNTKAIKVGYERRSVEFSDNPYIIAPLIRRDISTETTSCFIEVTERAELVEPNEVGEEELYKLYKNLRDLGLIWTDIKSDNVGRLLKDNIVHWDKPIAHEPKNLSLKERKGDTVLKAGELVILDADYIFEENSKIDVPPGVSHIVDKFSERYERELKQKEESLTTGMGLVEDSTSKKF